MAETAMKPHRWQTNRAMLVTVTSIARVCLCRAASYLGVGVASVDRLNVGNAVGVVAARVEIARG